MKGFDSTEDVYSDDFKSTKASTGIGKFLSENKVITSSAVTTDIADAGNDPIISQMGDISKPVIKETPPSQPKGKPIEKPNDFNDVTVLDQGNYNPHKDRIKPNGNVDISDIKNKFDKSENTINMKPEKYLDSKIIQSMDRSAFTKAKKEAYEKKVIFNRSNQETSKELKKPSYAIDQESLDSLLEKASVNYKFKCLWRLQTKGFRLQVAGRIYVDFSHKKFALAYMKEIDETPHKLVIYASNENRVIYDFSSDTIRVKTSVPDRLFLFNEVRKDKFLCAMFNSWSEKSLDNQIIFVSKDSSMCTCGLDNCSHLKAFKVWGEAKRPLVKSDRIISDEFHSIKPSLGAGVPSVFEDIPKNQ